MGLGRFFREGSGGSSSKDIEHGTNEMWELEVYT
jgi:hypothetical protein